MQTILELLIEARDRISDPSRWCQNTHARGASGEGVAPQSTEAVSWCSVGALYASVPERTQPGFFLFPGDAADARIDRAKRVLQAAIGKAALDYTYGYTVTRFNDSHSHEEIMAVWDKAIDLARRKK